MPPKRKELARKYSGRFNRLEWAMGVFADGFFVGLSSLLGKTPPPPPLPKEPPTGPACRRLLLSELPVRDHRRHDLLGLEVRLVLSDFVGGGSTAPRERERER